MPKTIRSGVRKILYGLIKNYQDEKSERDAVLHKKVQLFTLISEIADECIDDPTKLLTIRTSIKELKDLEETNIMNSETQYLKKISCMTGVSMSTLWRVKKEGSLNNEAWDTPGKKRPHKRTVSNLDDFDMNVVRNKVNEFYIVKKRVPTLRTLLIELRQSIEFTGCMETLRQILFKNGFEFKKNENERSVLMERYEIAAWRHKYLRTITEKRNENRPLIFLDETYVHQNYKVKKSWQGPSVSGVTDKISMGKRYIVVHAGSEHGFVPNAFLMFSTKSKLADYHHDMNASNFMKWLQEKLIPNLPQNSVVIMDNASYHVKQINKPPSTQKRKIEIKNWLTLNRIPYEECYSKDELLCLVNENKPIPQYEAEELLKQHGHEVLRLPPYHCDLNPIEMIWSLAKRRVASKNLGVPAKEMEKLIIESFSSITPNDWKKYTDHVIHVENKYKKRDNILEEELNQFIINVRDDSDSDDESDDDMDDFFTGIEFLESDFDYDS